MGCSASIFSTNSSKVRDRRLSKVTIESLETDLQTSSSIKKRYGHPSYYKADGFEIGLRVKVKGNFQSYFVGTARITGEKVTVKEHHTTNYPEDDAAAEIQLLSKLSHECLPKVSEIFITNISVFTVTDFIDSMRLKHFIDFKNKTSNFKPQDCRKIIKSIVSATSYCHANDVIIRNLTADNIMIKSTGNGIFEVKICDFCLAVPAGSQKVMCDHLLFDWLDVPFLAPEALLGTAYTTAMDVWSIGVLLYLMMCGELPFDSADDKELIRKIKHASFEFSHSNPVWSNAENDKIKYLIGELLVENASDRPTCKEIMKNPWLVVG